MVLNAEYPVVLLIGKTGAGKSTLGNLLIGARHDNGPFPTSARMDSVTQVCSVATMLIEGVPYNIVDTPGIFDTREGTAPVLDKIAKIVNKCAHGVKAILIVFEAKRCTEEQKNVLNEIRTFLGKDATNNIISVFSHATRAQTIDRNVMERDWNQSVRSFIQGIGNRWGISPDPDKFLPDEETHKLRLGEIKGLITRIQGVYTTTQLEKNLNKIAEAKRKKKEAEDKAKREYEERLKEDARIKAEKAHQREIERIQQESDKRHKQILDSMEQARQDQMRRERRLMKEIKSLQEEREHEKKQEKERQEKECEETRQILITLRIRYFSRLYFPSTFSLSSLSLLKSLEDYADSLPSGLLLSSPFSNLSDSLSSSLPPPSLHSVHIRKNEKVKVLEERVREICSKDHLFILSVCPYDFFFYTDTNTRMEKDNKISTYLTGDDNVIIKAIRNRFY